MNLRLGLACTNHYNFSDVVLSNVSIIIKSTVLTENIFLVKFNYFKLGIFFS